MRRQRSWPLENPLDPRRRTARPETSSLTACDQIRHGLTRAVSRAKSLCERARAHTELALERVIEVRDVAESRIERDVEHLGRPRRQATRGVLQPHPHDVLMRAAAGQPLEDPREMERAQVRVP